MFQAKWQNGKNRKKKKSHTITSDQLHYSHTKLHVNEIELHTYTQEAINQTNKKKPDENLPDCREEMSQ